MSGLTAFRDHCARMATAEHKPECPSLTAREPFWSAWEPVYNDAGETEAMQWRGPKPKWERPSCDGCLTDADRALFRQLAGEVNRWLDEQPLFEGAG